MCETVIELQGGKIFFTKNEKNTFLVKEGIVFVYVLPLKADGHIGRRYLLYEASEAETLPSFCIEDEEVTWVFGLVALDKAVLEECPDTMSEELGVTFVEKAHLANFGEETYKDQILEEYNRNLVKEENYIFATQQEQESTKRKILLSIYKLFDKDQSKQITQESGNHLYDAVAYLCDRNTISIAPYEKILASSGRRFRLEDVARISNFITREVILEDKWYKRDSGPIVAFTAETHKAVALTPKGNHRYVAYDPITRAKRVVDEKFASQLDPKAYLLYRPFPNEKITPMKMLAFGLKASDPSDWVRFALLTMLGTIIGILLPMLNEQIYDKYIPMSYSAGLIQICAVLLACNLGNLSFTIVKNLSSFRAVTKVESALLAASCERLFNLPESFFRKYESAELSDRVLKIESLIQLLSKEGIKTFVSALFSIMYLFQMWKYSEDLTKLGIWMVLGVLLCVIVIAVLQTKFESQLLENAAQANSKMYQFLVGIQKIRMAGVENRALFEYLKPYTETKNITMRKEKMTNLVSIILGSASSVFTVVLYYQMMEQQVQISVGQFSAFTAAFGAFTAAALGVGTALLKLNSIKPMLDRIRPILQELPEYSEEAELPGDLTGEIEISNVDFSYDKGENKILKGISLHIKAEEYIGIVGSSGCGKSTLMKLLLGFETPDSGKIYYDSKDIDGMDKRELRKKMGVVLQDGKLIAGSIFDNITISSPGATLKDAEQTAQRVGLAEDIAKMPMGMHTVLSAGGGTISGGQAQRILIARAIVGKPKILFFDEATSALDNVTQAMVCESLEKLRATRLVIAHRLSTIQSCDRIVVLDKGTIVEIGNYEELMKKKGLFYDLASRQMV